MNVIFKRASVRQFSDKEVPIFKVERLIKAGMQAPSACNAQPWEFLIVIDEEDIKAVSEMSPYAKAVANAQKVIITLANLDLLKSTNTEKWLQQDLSACTENILIQAVEEGLGAVWLGFFPEEERVNAIKKYFNIPDNIIPFSVVALGYPIEKPVSRKNFKSEKIHIGSY